LTSVITSQVQLRREGFEALVKALGWVNAVRFIREYETGTCDYVRERDAILPDWDAATLVKKALRQE
jgi:hypothetical protein